MIVLGGRPFRRGCFNPEQIRGETGKSLWFQTRVRIQAVVYLICHVHQFCSASVSGCQVTSGKSLTEELGRDTQGASGWTIVISVSSFVQ